MSHIEESLPADTHLPVALQRERERQRGLRVKPYVGAVAQYQVVLTAAGNTQFDKVLIVAALHRDGVALRGDVGIAEGLSALRQHHHIAIGQLQLGL